MTKEELAALINGREYGAEITNEEAAQAKAAGLIVVFGASDDLIELRGVLHDEAGAYGGTTVHIDSDGFIPDWDGVDHDDEEEAALYFKRKGGGKSIKANWDRDGYSWVIETELPHAAFDIVEDDEKFCRGIVFAAADLAS